MISVLAVGRSANIKINTDTSTINQMGFLTVSEFGHLVTYDEYKHLINLYRAQGILQFIKLYNAHKDREIAPENLHWGEEIEYKLYQFDSESKEVKLACDADDIIQDFTTQSDLLNTFSDVPAEQRGILMDMAEKPDFKLMPEFGNWMLEAVPTDPYGSYEDPN